MGVRHEPLPPHPYLYSSPPIDEYLKRETLKCLIKVYLFVGLLKRGRDYVEIHRITDCFISKGLFLCC